MAGSIDGVKGVYGEMGIYVKMIHFEPTTIDEGHFSVDTAMEECGLPDWLVSRQSWVSMGGQFRLEIGSRRQLNMTKYSAYNPNQNISQKAELTCRKIIPGQSQQSAMIVAYQKVGW